MEATKLGLYGAFAYLDIPIETFTILITFIGLDTFLGALASIRKFARKFIQSNLEKIEKAGDCENKK